MAPSRTVQPQASQDIDPNRRASRRRRISAIHRGAVAALDAAVEVRRDTEQVSADYDIRREDVQDQFAWETRRMVRKAEGLLRTIQQQLADVDAMLRGETRARKEPQAAGAGRDAGRAA